MSTSKMNAYLQTLSSITSTKSSIFSHQDATFRQHKAELLASLRQNPQIGISRLKKLVNEMSLPPLHTLSDPTQNLFAQMLDKNTTAIDTPTDILQRLKYLLLTAESDPAITQNEEVLEELIGTLELVLEQQERRMDVAKLVGRIVQEWVDARGKLENNESTSENLATAELKKEQLEMFKSLVFSPHPLDLQEPGVQQNIVKRVLDDLFEATSGGQKFLSQLRQKMRVSSNFFPKSIAADKSGVSYISSLVSSLANDDIFLADKKSFLQDQVLPNERIREELRDILRMWAGDLGNWTWESAGLLGSRGGVKLQPRFHINGRYRVYLDLDPTVALFAHHVGTWFGTRLKEDLKAVFDFKIGAWKGGDATAMEDAKLREKFTRCGLAKENPYQGTISYLRRTDQKNIFFLNHLQDGLDSAGGGYAGVGEEQDAPAASQNKKVAEPSRLVKERILHTLMAEFHLARALATQDGSKEFTVVVSDFKWFGPSLSHETIAAVLSYFGFSDDMVGFFRRYLSVPCYFDGEEEAEGGIKRRARGIPLGHALCDMSAELLLFCLDFLVNQVSDGEVQLYRCFDDLWFWGRDRKKCELVWRAMQNFAKNFGLEFNLEKSGSLCFNFNGKGDLLPPGDTSGILPNGPVKWGLLELTPSGTLIQNQDLVQTHIKELTRQLTSPRSASSILSFTSSWNRYFATFVPYHLCPPAYALGKSHSLLVLNQLSTIPTSVLIALNNGIPTTLTNFLRKQITSRFPGIDGGKIPDAWFYWPSELGGLGLRNPILKLGAELVWRIDKPGEARSVLDVEHDPEAIVEPEAYLAWMVEQDKHVYDRAKEAYLTQDANANADTDTDTDMDLYSDTPTPVPTHITTVKPPFPTQEEFFSVAAREKFFSAWGKMYSALLSKPQISPGIRTEVLPGAGVARAMQAAGLTENGEYMVRLLGLYGAGVVKRWGGLRLVEKEWVPGGLLEGAREDDGGWEE